MKNYYLEENEFGYILTNGNLKYILYKSKFNNGKYAPYFLKQVKPTETYISGMFVEKPFNNKFNGKYQNNSVVVILYPENEVASIFFNDRNAPKPKYKKWKHNIY